MSEISEWLNRDVTGLSTEYLIFDLCQLNQYIGGADALASAGLLPAGDTEEDK